MSSAIFKLLFEHDLRLEQLSGIDEGERDNPRRPSSLEEFMKPVQTYSRFYLSGTLLDQHTFGLSALEQWPDILNRLWDALGNPEIITSPGSRPISSSALNPEWFQPGAVLVTSKDTPFEADHTANRLFSGRLSVREKIPAMRPYLDQGSVVLYVEKAADGIDLHFYSKENIYESLFDQFKPLLNSDLRIFSINGKRCKSERLFYFETWTLDRPPHGFEEVFEETKLR